MAAFIPNRKDAEINDAALKAVRADKSREADDGFDGSWVANQLDRSRDDVQVTSAQLLAAKATPGQVTDAGVRNNVSVAIQYLESWLRGGGAVAIFNLMEDAATAEISRSQIWQWVQNGASTAEASRSHRSGSARLRTRSSRRSGRRSVRRPSPQAGTTRPASCSSMSPSRTTSSSSSPSPRTNGWVEWR